MYRKKKWLGFLIISPTLAVIGIFVYGFIGATVRASLSDWNSFKKLLSGEFVYTGLRNYERLFADWRFQTDMWNTLFFTVFFLFGCLLIGLILASLLDRPLKGGRVFQSIFLFPMALSLVVTGRVWRWFFAPGILPNDPAGINVLLGQIGLKSLQWNWFTVTDTIGPFNLALIPVIIAAVWQLSGYTMAMYLAGLRAIPESMTEAARVDGANAWQTFWKVKWPFLRPITLSAMIILGHISLKIFDLVYSMTGSGPKNVTDMPSIYMFEKTFRSNRYAEGSAIAVIMLLMVAVVIIPYLISTLKKSD